MSKTTLNEISQKTLASYIQKSSERLEKNKDKNVTKPLKGSTASVTTKKPNAADELADKLKKSGKGTGFIDGYKSKPETTKYTFKGQQWVSDKGKMATKDVGEKLSKENISKTGGHNKASERLKSIQQASKRLQDKNYQKQDKINSTKSKIKSFTQHIGSEIKNRTERDIPKAQKLASDIKTGAENAYRTMKPHVQKAYQKAKEFVKEKGSIAATDASVVGDMIKKGLESRRENKKSKTMQTSSVSKKKDASLMNIHDINLGIKREKEKEQKAKDIKELEKKVKRNGTYKIPVNYKSKWLGKKQTDVLHLSGKNHWEALEKARKYTKDYKLRDATIGKHTRIG